MCSGITVEITFQVQFWKLDDRLNFPKKSSYKYGPYTEVDGVSSALPTEFSLGLESYGLNGSCILNNFPSCHLERFMI
jgi:hypothetical protein